MKTSIVIPTLNAGRQLATILDAIRHQTFQPFETLVLDSESDDDTRSIAKQFGARVLSIARKQFDHGATRNVGLDSVRGDIVVYTVQDAVPADEKWLANLCMPIMNEERVGMVTGRQIPRAEATPLEQVTRLLTYPIEGYRRDAADLARMGLRAAFSTDTNAAYRATALRSVGRFPEPCIVNEDMAAAVRLMRAGYVLVYEPHAAIIHSHNYGLREQFQRYFDLGVFFAGNELAGVGKSTTNAFWYIRNHLNQVLSRETPMLALAWLLDTVARTTGVLLGRNYKLVPRALRPYLSRQKHYWQQKR